MTAAAGISSAPAARPASAAAKPPESGNDQGSKPDSTEFAAFSELFSHLEPEGDVSGDPAAKKDDPEPDGGAEALAALTLEMTHHRWFGGSDPVPSPDDGTPRRNAPVLVQRKDDEPPSPAAPRGTTPMPPFGMSGWFDPQPANAGAAGQPGQNSAAASANVRVEQINVPSQDEQAQAAKLQEIAETLAKVQAQGRKHPSPSASAASQSASGPSPAAAPILAANTPNPAQPDARDALSANLKESLFALETVLSKGGSTGGAHAQTKDGRQLGPAVIREARITAIRQETYFMPGNLPSPAMQIADRIDRDIQANGPPSAPQADLPSRPDAAPIRILHIQLDPPQLGPLTIRLSLKDDALNLQLATPHYETAKLIHDDKDALTGLLRSAGYTVDGLNIQVAHADKGSGGQPFSGAGPFGQPAGQQPGWRQPGGQSSARPVPGFDTSDSTAGGSGHEQPGPETVKPRGGSVYL